MKSGDSSTPPTKWDRGAPVLGLFHLRSGIVENRVLVLRGWQVPYKGAGEITKFKI